MNLQDDVGHLRRVLRRYDTPLTHDELATNPALNPALNNYVPFDTQVMVNEFFQSRERIAALTAYVVSNTKWEPSTFPKAMLDKTVTLSYRYDHAYPGDNVHKNLTYIPDKLRQFFESTAKVAAKRIGQMVDEKKFKDQMRVLFQKNIVERERKRKEDMDRPPSKRRRTYEGFPSDDDTHEEPREEEDWIAYHPSSQGH